MDNMDEISHLASRRSSPGIIIMDLNKNILFMNRKAKRIVGEFIENISTDKGEVTLPHEIYTLCDRLKSYLSEDRIIYNHKSEEINESFIIYSNPQGDYIFRGFFIGKESAFEPNILVLIEKISKRKKKLNIEKTLKELTFTPREKEIIEYVFQGYTNKEIANTLSLSEHTVKQHIKRVMNKLNVTTRTGIMSKIISLS
ncbi:MAG: helix-turn-helix transcriptional regulator [Nitrospirota bacterium]